MLNIYHGFEFFSPCLPFEELLICFVRPDFVTVLGRMVLIFLCPTGSGNGFVPLFWLPSTIFHFAFSQGLRRKGDFLLHCNA